MIEIVIDRDYSLSDLLDLRDNGYKVFKTPHVGNQYMNNLVIAVLGFDILVYDRNIGSKDKNFHPQSIIYNSREEKVFSENELTIHSKKILERTKDSFINKLLLGYTNPGSFHTYYFSKASKNQKIRTYSEFISKNREIITKIIHCTYELYKDDWYRYVNKEKKIIRKTGFVADDPILGLTDDDFGWVIPNIYNILFHCVIDQKEGKVFLLSGPDMYRYICKHEEKLSASWKSIKKEFTDLPNEIKCLIIPVSKLRFAVPIEHKMHLDDILEKYYAIKECQNRLATKHLDTKKEQKYLILKKQCVKDIRLALSENADLYKRTIFYDISEATSYSQFDLLKSKKLYIPEVMMTRKISEVEDMYDELLRYFKSSKYVDGI